MAEEPDEPAIPRQAPTIQAVARAAGVAPSTVSRVLNGKTRGQGATADRVLRAAAELGYRPNASARDLRSGISKLWGLIVPDLGNPFYSSIIRGLEPVAREAGYGILTANSNEDPALEEDLIENMAAERVAGIVIAATSSTKTDIGPFLTRNAAVVAIDRHLTRWVVDEVLVDNRAGARDATLHLFDNGARRVACVTGPRRASTAAERVQGYRQALAGRGLQADAGLIRYSDFQREGGAAATRSLLQGPGAPDGLLVANNRMTLGAVEAIIGLGLRMPDDIRLVGYDEIDWAPFMPDGALTTVYQPAEAIGEEAGRLLRERLRAPGRPRQMIVFQPELRVQSDLQTPPVHRRTSRSH